MHRAERVIVGLPPEPEQTLTMPTKSPVQRMIFQLGTNNWQRADRDGNLEFAPGSGVLHEAHHRTYNAMPGTVCYSIYPSEGQPQPTADDIEQHFRVFELGHQIPICESVSPVSSKRWHGFSEAEFEAYRDRLAREVFDYMVLAEQEQGTHFTMVISHHCFLNPLVMRDVLKRRADELGRGETPHFNFCHGTSLKMFAHELRGDNPAEFPMRFHKMMIEENVFGDGGITGAFAISTDQKAKAKAIFPTFPDDRLVVSPNGVNPQIFYPRVGHERKSIDTLLAEHVPHKGEVTRSYAKAVVFIGKFANWKRLDAVLRAAARYQEEEGDDVCFIVLGSGPDDAVALYHGLHDSLGLQHTFFLGPKPQPVLAEICAAASVGVFPSYAEPFGMVFVECMACGTPVIGANSGGPRDFVTDAVGGLFAEPAERYDWAAITDSVFTLVKAAIDDDWKSSKGPACTALAQAEYSVTKQCHQLLAGADALVAQ